jgi:hypothetical protein
MVDFVDFIMVRYPPESNNTSSDRVDEGQLRLRIKGFADMLDVVLKFRPFEKVWNII